MPWLIFWFIIVVVSGASSLMLASHYTWVSYGTVVPIVGESVLQPAGAPPAIVGMPSVAYSTTEASSFITTFLRATPRATEIDLVISDVIAEKPCSIIGGAILGKPEFIERRTLATRVGESHQIAAYRIRVLPNLGKLVSVTCNVSDAPGEDSYATRNIQYVPMASPVQGFRQIFPQRVAFEIAGNVDISVNGDVASGPIAHFLEEREVGPDNFTLRARWTSVQAQGRKDFGLFVAAVIAGISGSALVEFVRRTFELILARREHTSKE